MSQRDRPVRIKFTNNLPTGRGGAGYTGTPVVNITDPTGTGAVVTPTMALGVIKSVTVTNGGSGYTSAPNVVFTGGGGTGIAATATIYKDAVSGIVMTNAGSGYTSAPTVSFTGGGGGVGAAAIASAPTGVISSFTVINGAANYSASPTISFTGGGGSGATAEATVTAGVITAVSLTSPGDLFIPVDTTAMGAGTGPNGGSELYTENRATLHLHGGITPWISDGTPHQWTTPAGENTSYPEGVSVQNVPDMPDPGPGSLNFFYTNQQSARLMFYHDHAYGITRLNVYGGEAAGYLVTDQVEQDLINGTNVSGVNPGLVQVLPGVGIPLVIQDKTFVPSTAQLATEDPTWDIAKWGGLGNLWFPHVYMPNQNPYDLAGANPMGRWDYGPWFWPPYSGLQYGPVANPYYDPINAPWEPPFIPGTPNPSIVPEAFMDTSVVNGTVYPYLTVEPKAYRFRILNAANERFLNLQLYYAAANGNMWDPVTGALLNADAGEVPMVPASPGTGLPATWPTDGRDGGVPNPAAVGPTMIQIGTEGGFLPAPVALPNTPLGYNYNRRDITVLNVLNKTLFIAPAERADVIIDFSQVPPGSNLILYNDAPAPVPAFDSRFDYYTGAPDQTPTGGAPPTQPGYGPNTRTIMQIRVAGTPAAAFNQATLNTVCASTATTQGVFAKDQDNAMTFTPAGSATPLTINFAPKAIQELFTVDYGRMNATLGVELPFTNIVNQTTIPLAYIDPPTENITDSITPMSPVAGDGTQIWKITHNGVDTHVIHFHLFNVQLLNRVGWDSAIAGTRIQYTRTLQAGDSVSGSVQLTGAPETRDGSYVWTFQVLGPAGKPELEWTDNWMNNYYYPFTFTVPSAGTYWLVVIHHSSYPKQLTIQITPPGWQFAGR